MLANNHEIHDITEIQRIGVTVDVKAQQLHIEFFENSLSDNIGTEEASAQVPLARLSLAASQYSDFIKSFIEAGAKIQKHTGLDLGLPAYEYEENEEN